MFVLCFTCFIRKCQKLNFAPWLCVMISSQSLFMFVSNPTVYIHTFWKFHWKSNCYRVPSIVRATDILLVRGWSVHFISREWVILYDVFHEYFRDQSLNYVVKSVSDFQREFFDINWSDKLKCEKFYGRRYPNHFWPVFIFYSYLTNTIYSIR